MATAIWNASDALNTSLDATKLIATCSSGQAAIRANQGQSSGRYYWECTFTTAAHSDTGCGIANITAPLGSTGSNATGACFIYKGFPVYLNGSSIGISIGTVSTGSVIGIAVDFTAQTIWFRIAPSGNWNGNATYDPAAGTGGISFAAIATNTIFPAASMWQTNDSITGNFGATAFSGTVPTGFTSGLPVATDVERLEKITAYAPLIQGEELRTVKSYSVLLQGQEVGTVKAYGVLLQQGVSARNVKAYAVLYQTAMFVTQMAVEEWAPGVPTMQLTQIAVEEWAPGVPALQLTQIAVEEWTSVASSDIVNAIGVKGTGQVGSPKPKDKVVLLCHFDGTNGSVNFTDSSTYAHTLTATSATVSTASPKFGTGAGDFISSGASRIDTGPAVADFNLGSGQFTVEAWAYFTSAPSGVQAVLSQFGFNSNLGWFFGMVNGPLAFYYSTTGNDNPFIGGAYTPALNTWIHLAADRDSSNVLRVYANGVVIASATMSATIFPSTQHCLIGNDNNNSRAFPGRLDDARITIGLAQYGGAFVPSNQPFGSQNLSLTGVAATGKVGLTSPNFRVTQVGVNTWVQNATATPFNVTQVGVNTWVQNTTATPVRVTHVSTSVWIRTDTVSLTGVSATGKAGIASIPPPSLRVTQVGARAWAANSAPSFSATQIGARAWVANSAPSFRATQVGARAWIANSAPSFRATQVGARVWVRTDTLSVRGVSATGIVGIASPRTLRVTQLGSSAWVKNTATPLRATQIGSSAWVQNTAPPFRATQVGASIWVRLDASVAEHIIGVSGTAQLGVTSNQVESSFLLQKQLIGQAATGQVSVLGNLITQLLTGLSGTGQLGKLEPSQRGPPISMVLSASRSGIGSVFVVEDAARLSMVTGIGAVVNAPMTTRQLTGVSALALASAVKLPSAMRGITCLGQTGTEQVSITVQISGVNSTAMAHSVVGNVTIPATGVEATGLIHAVFLRQFNGTIATGLAGVLGKRLDNQIKGVRGNGLAGNPRARESFPITGVSGNGSSGNVVPSIAVRLASVHANALEGHFPVLKRILGVSATGLVGALTESIAATRGVNATGLVGFINKAIAGRIIGVQGNGFVASIRGANRIIGVYGTGRCGILYSGNQITGVHGSGLVGSIVIIRYVKGLFATALLGALRPAILIRITGNQAVGQVGQVTPHSFGDMTFVHITGVACIGYAGHLTPHSFGDRTFVPITGVGGVGQVGRATTRMRGASGTARCGQVVARITLRLNGLLARGRAGVLVPQGSKHRYWQIMIRANDGGSIYSMAEVQFRSVPDTPLLFSGGTASATQSATSPANATDDDTSTYWSSSDTSAGQDWQYDYGIGNGLNVLQVSITARCDNDTGYLETPSSFNLQWSDNGLSWITVGTFATTWTERCETQVFDVTELETALQLTGTARETIVIDQAVTSLSALALETITEYDVTALIGATICEVLRTSDLQPTRISVDMVLCEIVNIAMSRGLLSNIVRETLDVDRGTIGLENMAREIVVTMAMSSTTIMNLVREIINTTIANLQVYGLVCEVLRDPNVAPTRIEVVGMARESVIGLLTSAELAGLIREVISQIDAVSQWSGVVREVLRTPDAKPIRIELDGFTREALVDTKGRAQSSTLAREATVMSPAALRMDHLAREVMEITPMEGLVSNIVHEVMDIVDAQMWMSTMALELLRSTSSKPSEIVQNTMACESVYITTSIMDVATMAFETLVKIPVDEIKSSAVARETMSREITAMKSGGVVREVLIAGREPPMLINVSVNM